MREDISYWNEEIAALPESDRKLLAKVAVFIADGTVCSGKAVFLNVHDRAAVTLTADEASKLAVMLEAAAKLVRGEP